MDFIVKFLKSENISIDIKYDSILIIIDRLIKDAHFISCAETLKAK